MAIKLFLDAPPILGDESGRVKDGGVIVKTKLISVKQTLSVACLACLILSGAVYGQTQPQRSGTTGAPSRGSGSGGGSTGVPRGERASPDVILYDTDDYKLAPRDVIEVIVEDAQELSVSYTINAAGIIPLRFLGATPVAGLTTDEVSKLITDGLRNRYLKDPKVYVSVKQYNSRTFFIQGAVRAPGVYVISGKPSLFRLMTIAGGLQENHGLTAYIFREKKANPEKMETGEQSGEDKRLKEIVNNAKGTDPEAVIEGEPDYELITANIGGILVGRLKNDLIVQPGDVVYVPPADVFYIAGEVRAPGQFQLRQGLTLRQALSLAGGHLFKAKLDKGVIFRTDPVTGNFSEVSVDIGAVLKGDKQDIPILGNDVIWVPNSNLKAFGATVLNSFLPTAIFRLPGIR